MGGDHWSRPIDGARDRRRRIDPYRYASPISRGAEFPDANVDCRACSFEDFGYPDHSSDSNSVPEPVPNQYAVPLAIQYAHGGVAHGYEHTCCSGGEQPDSNKHQALADIHRSRPPYR